MNCCGYSVVSALAFSMAWRSFSRFFCERTLPRVICVVNGFVSLGIPSFVDASSIWAARARVSTAPVSMPTQITRAKVGFGKTPSSFVRMRNDFWPEAIFCIAVLMCPTVRSLISPRNLRVKWIFFGSTHLMSAPLVFRISWSLRRLSCASSGRGIAIKALIR